MEQKQLSKTQWWLVFHQMIAFWHGFGISNGLYVEPEDLEPCSFKNRPNLMRVKPEVMQKKLEEYLGWLENYKESWGSKQYENMPVGSREEIEKDKSDKPFLGILRMIELLQA